MGANDMKKPTVDTMDRDKPQQQPFRFLDLPKELRLMVYDHLPTYETTRIICKKGGHFDLVTRTECIPILQTCRTINDEASDHMKSNRSRYLASSEPEIFMMYTGALVPRRPSPWIFRLTLIASTLRLIFSIIKHDNYERIFEDLRYDYHNTFSVGEGAAVAPVIDRIYKFARQTGAMLKANPTAVLHIRDGFSSPLLTPEEFPILLDWYKLRYVSVDIKYWNQKGENWLLE
jgi:hypothetical protein